MDEKVIEEIYQESLEERIISHIASKHEFSYEESMAVYYRSRLADKIYLGKEDIQYLDYKVLVDIIEETEPELFKQFAEK